MGFWKLFHELGPLFTPAACSAGAEPTIGKLRHWLAGIRPLRSVPSQGIGTCSVAAARRKGKIKHYRVMPWAENVHRLRSYCTVANARKQTLKGALRLPLHNPHAKLPIIISRARIPYTPEDPALRRTRVY